jgi:hypothetical protein
VSLNLKLLLTVNGGEEESATKVLNSNERKSIFRWVQMAHTCNPSYSGRQKSGGLWFETSSGK